MPWSTSDRRTRLPKDWHAQRAATYRQAGGRCQHTNPDGTRCLWTGPLNGRPGQPGGHADHIRPSDDTSPLQWLCPTHHGAKSSAEGHAAMRAQRAKLHHPTERHPGLR
jgi:5-methylcytosine-specific restriction protein A